MMNINSSGKYYKLTNDIDLSAHYWDIQKNFYGNLNGNGKYIKNLFKSSSYGSGGGLIEDNSGTINNLKFSSPSVSSTADTLGIIARTNSGTISNCEIVNGSLTGSYITSRSFIGGITGINYGTVFCCKVTGTISATRNARLEIGGLVGVTTAGASVRGGWFEGTVTSTSYPSQEKFIGGICGTSDGVTNNCVVVNSNLTGPTTYGSYSEKYLSRTDYFHNPVIGYDKYKYTLRYEKIENYNTKVGGITSGPYAVYACSVYNTSITGKRGTAFKSSQYGPSAELPNYKDSYGTKGEGWAYIDGNLGVSGGTSSYFSDIGYTKFNRLASWAGWSSSSIINNSSYSSYASNGYTYSSSTGSYCLSSVPTSVPSGWDTSIWAVTSYINGGKIHFKSWYWQDNV